MWIINLHVKEPKEKRAKLNGCFGVYAIILTVKVK
jgi:hypothetical protein